MLIATIILAATVSVASPDGRLKVDFTTDATGMSWALAQDGQTLVQPSRLGVRFAKSNPRSEKAADFAELRIVDTRTRTGDSVWESKAYRRGRVRDHFNELAVDLEETEARAVRIGLGQTEVEYKPRRLTLEFRAYDEGVAFRYVFPEQEAFDGFELADELTEWRFADDPTGWVTEYASHLTSQECPFNHKKISGVAGDKLIGMPLLVETAGRTLALTEAALVNWAGMFFRNVGEGETVLKADLAKLPASSAATAGSAVVAMTPASSPWRVVLVGADEVDLLRKNDVIASLNPPPDPTIDFSFVKPGATSWDWWVESNNSLSTELTLKLVDFAAEMGWPYHTIDGGWYGFARRPNHGPNVPLQPRKGFDLERIVRHAAAKGVGIWVWIHWQEIEDTGIEETFARLEKWGVKGVKTDFLDRQDQWIVNWYERVARAAAKHRVMVNFHGAFKPTGTERTWPNNLTREGILGNEMNLFTRKITPEHCATLPFTRLLIGPGDFTPGSFANQFSKDFVPQNKKGHRYGDETDRCPHWAEQMGTRAYALAQCIAYDSYLTTLCDWPERYRGAAGVAALRSLPTTWKATEPVAGRCGEYYAVVREAHDGRFCFAAFTVKARGLDLPLNFLGDGQWKAELFTDDPARTPSDAKALAEATRSVAKGETLHFDLCDEGGAVAIFTRTDNRITLEGDYACGEKGLEPLKMTD